MSLRIISTQYEEEGEINIFGGIFGILVDLVTLGRTPAVIQQFLGSLESQECDEWGSHGWGKSVI